MRKRNIKTRQIKKKKSTLNADGSIMKKGIHYTKMYSTEAGCYLIRILIILVALEGCKTMQVDYVQTFP